MHDIYEIIMFPPTTANQHRLHSAFRSNRDNMNFLVAFLKVLSTWLDYTLFGFSLWCGGGGGEEFVGIKSSYVVFL